MMFLAYYGGKRYLINELLNLIPNHVCYVEVFGGAANLLLNKQPSKIEVYNDIDDDIVDLFRVLQDENLSEEFSRKIQFIPYSRKIFQEAKLKYRNKKFDNILDKAITFFIVSQMSFSMNKSTFSVSKITNHAKCWANKSEKIFHVYNRFKHVIIENLSFERLIPKYDSENTFFYCDPPYIHETRITTNDYKFECNNEQHKQLVELLLNINGKCLLSGYDHDLYNRLVKNGWNKIEYEKSLYCNLTKNTTRRKKRIECLWYNYKI